MTMSLMHQWHDTICGGVISPRHSLLYGAYGCILERGVTDIEPIAPMITVNRLVLEWEEKIKLHQEKEMKFDKWRSKIFNNKHLASVKEECEVEDEGGVT
ncbi:hypothetical protein Tco_1500943 [Tanacetum coccineum]